MSFRALAVGARRGCARFKEAVQGGALACRCTGIVSVRVGGVCERRFRENRSRGFACSALPSILA